VVGDSKIKPSGQTGDSQLGRGIDLDPDMLEDSSVRDADVIFGQ
jgi:hypothetical protein